MAAAKPYMDERRRAQAGVAKANRARGASNPCGVKGCTRHSYKGRMCRKHWAEVPRSLKVEAQIAAMDAQMRTAGTDPASTPAASRAVVAVASSDSAAM